MKAIKSTAKSININLLGEQVKVSIITDGTYVDLITKTDSRLTIDGIHTDDGYRRINRQYVKQASVIGYEEYVNYAKSCRLVHHMDGLEELIDTHIEAAYQTVDFGWLMDRAYVAYATDESERTLGDDSALAAYAIASGWYTIAGSDTAKTCTKNAIAEAIRVMGATCDALHKALASTETKDEEQAEQPTKATEKPVVTIGCDAIEQVVDAINTNGYDNYKLVVLTETSMHEACARIASLDAEAIVTILGTDDLYGLRGDARTAVINARNILRLCKANESIAEQAVRELIAAKAEEAGTITIAAPTTEPTTDQQVAADAVKQPSKSVEAIEQQTEEMIISKEPTTETTTEATEQPSAAAVIAAIILAATSVIEHIAGITLTGSPKQVAWATDIRVGWLNLIAQTLRSALNDAIAEHDIVQAAYAAEASAKSLANIAGCTAARAIIDARYTDTVYELQHKALNKADEDVRQTLLDAAKNATEADIAAVLDQPKSEADILAEKLEAAGGNRWTKGTNDRVYVDIVLLGAEIEHYKTGNVSNATWCGESVSNADGRRLEATKVYVDLSNGELNVITNFSSYSLPSVEEQAQAWYNAALRDGEPTDPEPTTTEATDADATEAEAEEMIISDTTTEKGSDCYFTTDELAALEAAGFRRWQRNGLDRLYYSGDCFEAGIYAIYSDAKAKVYVDVTDGEMHVEAHPRCIEGHILDHVGRIYTDALISVRAEASMTTEADTEQPTELAAAIAATISGIADHEQVSLWLDASDRNALSVWEQCAYGITYAASEGCASEVAEETIENARRVYDTISSAWMRMEPSSVLYDELHAEVSEMALWLDAIETLESDGEPMTTENVIKVMRGDDDEPTDPNDNPTTTEADEGTDYEAGWRAKHPHTTTATVWVPSYGAVCAMSARSLPIGIVTVCTGGVTETIVGKTVSKSGKTVTLTVRDESGTTHTRRRSTGTMVAVRGHRINRSVWHIDWPTENVDEADTFTNAEAETTDQPATSPASDHTNIATRIMDLWDDFDPHTYGDCCTDNGIEEVRFELEHDPAQMLGLLNDVIEDGTTEQATRAMAIIDAIERLDGDKAEEINHDKKEAPMPTMPTMPTIRLTGGIIKGKRHIGEAHKSGKPYDTPTDERGIVTLDGETYERTVYERRTWYNMRPHKLLARYVIINNVNYEVMSRRNAAYDRWTAERDEDGLFTGVYDFEDGKSWMSCLGDVYVLHSEADGEEYRTDFRDDYPDTGDESVFTAACDFLDKMATGWRPVNWQA